MQTHIALELNGSHEEKLLAALRTFREISRPDTLEFDEIMQRDIDDARVAHELIPYLLDQKSSGLVKFFPPIIIVVLPTKSKQPIAQYPEVKHETKETDDGYTWSILRSGRVGEEAFEFKQLLVEGKALPHDYAELNLNTQATSLVIVDGQHRAMALLALYRNLTKWPEDTLAWNPYYKRWTSRLLQSFDLQSVQLPVLVCTFPELNSANPAFHEIKVSNACRSLFLALNKNARPVSKSRNYLLDDHDIIAHFLRSTLSKIKEFDANSSDSLRLFNVELDSEENRKPLTTPIALTGIMHLYPLIEHLMLDDRGVQGVKAGKSNVFLIKNLAKKCIRVLQAQEELGEELSKGINRVAVPREAERVLVGRFEKRYRDILVRGLAGFLPYQYHTDAALKLEVELRKVPPLHAILFEGQSVARTFQEYTDGLDKAIKEYPVAPAELSQLLQEAQGVGQEVKKIEKQFQEARAKKLLNGQEASPAVYAAIERLYSDTLTTSAFQQALFSTFFSIAEGVGDARRKAEGRLLSDDELRVLFDEYLDSINAYFVVSKWKDMACILNAFCGLVEGERGQAEVKQYKRNLRHILIPGELKPDYMFRYRYVFLELWQPRSTGRVELVAVLERQRRQARTQLIQMLNDRDRLEYLHSNRQSEGALTAEVIRQLQAKCIEDFKEALHALKVKVEGIRKLEPYLEKLLTATEDIGLVSLDSDETE